MTFGTGHSWTHRAQAVQASALTTYACLLRWTHALNRFTKETITGSEATVEATLEISNEGRKIRIAMDYKLLYKGDRWLVYDVITDEQSMLETYRAEFDKIITEKSFDALLKRMKKGLERTE